MLLRCCPGSRRGVNRSRLAGGVALALVVLFYFTLPLFFANPYKDLIPRNLALRDRVHAFIGGHENFTVSSKHNSTTPKKAQARSDGKHRWSNRQEEQYLKIVQQSLGHRNISAACPNVTVQTLKIPRTTEERLGFINKVCGSQGSKIMGHVERVFVYEKRKVSYCSTYKIASTYWIRVFRWLYNDTQVGHVSSPLLISKFTTHLTPFRRLITRSLKTQRVVDRTLIENSYRFLFTRDPYARLWSVYIDKFVLPDNYFWSRYTPQIKSAVHRPMTKCANVTFNEFLQYIVYKATTSSGAALDDHFRPVHYGCNPCKFRPHFVGYMETMRDDSAEVLRRMNLDLPELSSNHVEQEVDMLTDFNFELVVAKRYQSRCVSNVDLEKRLLQTFVYNGYIPSEKQNLIEGKLPLGRTRFKQAVVDMYHSYGQSSTDIRKQREKYKFEAYRQIPKDVLLGIQKIFYWDFELFGYEPFPQGIFNK